MRRSLALGLVASAVLGLSSHAHSDEPGYPHLPDLQTVVPSEFHVTTFDSGARELRFSNSVWNAGDGPLELRPEHDQDAGVTHAFQLIYSHDESGQLYATGEEHPAGSFEFHEDHDHWHFADLARYELVEPAADGGIGTNVVALSDKVSFCLFDEFQRDATLEHTAPARRFIGFDICRDPNAHVGYSVGWGDEYGYSFVDQDIDITGVAPGHYWLRSTADPADLLLETDDENNWTAAEIILTDDDVRVVTETDGSVCAPCGRTHLRRDDSYQFRGTSDPAGQGTTMMFSYKRPHDDAWRAFGNSTSNKAFTLGPSGGVVTSEGEWNRRFAVRKSGTWKIRAVFPSDGYLARSAVTTRVTVSD